MNDVIGSLMEQRAGKVEELSAMLEAQDYSDEHTAKCKEVRAEIEAINGKIEVAMSVLDEARAEAEEEAVEDAETEAEETRAEEQPEENEERGEEEMTQNTNISGVDFEHEASPEVRAEKRSNTRNEIRAFLKGESRANETVLTGNQAKAFQYSQDIIDTISVSSNIVNKVGKVFFDGTYKQIVAKSGKKQTASWTAEAAQISAVESQWETLDITPVKLTALATVSLENYYMSAFDVLADVERQQMRAITDALESGIFNGNGSGKPYGLTTGGTAYTLAANTTITADEVIAIYHKLNPNYLGNAAWYMSQSTLQAVRTLKDGDSQYLFHQNDTLESSYAGTLLGKPVYVTAAISDLEKNKPVIIFGDVERGYKLNVNPASTYQILQERYADVGCIGVLNIMWAGGRPVDNDAYVTVSTANLT